MPTNSLLGEHLRGDGNCKAEAPKVGGRMPESSAWNIHSQRKVVAELSPQLRHPQEMHSLRLCYKNFECITKIL